jgi:hypothetical protein
VWASYRAGPFARPYAAGTPIAAASTTGRKPFGKKFNATLRVGSAASGEESTMNWMRIASLVSLVAFAMATSTCLAKGQVETLADQADAVVVGQVQSGTATGAYAKFTFVAGNCIQVLPGFHASAIGATVPTTFHAWVETALAVLSVSPPSGSGLSQAFTWTVSSPSGYGNLSDVFALFNTYVTLPVR